MLSTTTLKLDNEVGILYKITPETTYIEEDGQWKNLHGFCEAYLPFWAQDTTNRISWELVAFHKDGAYIISKEID